MQKMDIHDEMDSSETGRDPARTGRPPLFSPEDLDQMFEAAARSGLHTPERLERMRKRGIRPATRPWRPHPQPVKLRPRWLAFLLRTWNRVTGRRPFFD